MVLKVYGIMLSTCTQRVVLTLKEKNVPYELIFIDMIKVEHQSEEYMKKQPFGQVPYIDDDGFILFESRAISRYIAAKYRDQGTPLVPDPADLKATALFEQAASIEFSNWDPFAGVIVVEKLLKPAKGGKTNEALVESHLATLTAKLHGYEAILSKQKYLAGDSITLADLSHLPFGRSLAVAGFDLLESGKYPNVTRWWKDISSRPAWREVLEAINAEASQLMSAMNVKFVI